MAQCYRRINYTAKAIGAYQNAVRYGYPDSTALLYLGQLQQKNGDYKSAIKSYTAFLEKVPGDTLALNGLKGCELAPKWKNTFSLYSVKKEPILTSRRSDFCPALLGDESDMLYFSSTRNDAKGNEISGITGTKSADIFFTKKDDKGKWEPVEVRQDDVPDSLHVRQRLSTLCTDLYKPKKRCILVEAASSADKQGHSFQLCPSSRLA